MTSSVQSTAFQSSARPVDTFVAPPKSGIESLAETLAVVNPNIQKFLGTQIDLKAEEEKQQGIDLVLQADKGELQDIISQVKKREGSKAARQLIGGNIFFQAGVEEQLAKTLGSTAEFKTKTFFKNYKVNRQLADGSTIQVPLNQYDINSSEFQTAVEEYNQNFKTDVSGIRSLYVNKYFLPKQSAALQKAIVDQIENNNEYKVQKAEDDFQSSLLLNFLNIDDNQQKITDGLIEGNSGLDVSRNQTQEFMERLVSQGLTEAVSPTSLIENLIDVSNNLYLKYEEQELDGFDAVEDLLEYAGELKVGPKQITKDGKVSQKKLSDFYGEDIRKLKYDLITANDKFRDEQERKYKEVEEQVILEMLERYSFIQTDEEGNTNREVVNALINAFPERFDDFIEPLVIEQDFSRDAWFRNFENEAFLQGKYENDPIGARKELINFEQSLGNSITSEDRSKLDALKSELQTEFGRGSLGNVATEIKDVIKVGKDILGEEGKYGTYIKQTNVAAFEDASSKFREQVRTLYRNKNLTPEDRNTQYKQAIKRFYKDVYLIQAEKYKIEGIFKGLQEEALKEVQNENSNFNENTNSSNPFNVNNFDNNQTGNKLFMDRFKSNNDQQSQGSEDLVSQLENLIQRLLPGGGSPAMAGGTEGKPRSYTVKGGDTLETIANEFNVNLDDLVDINKIKDPNFIREGQPLTIPAPRVRFIDRYRDKPVPDFGGLGKLVISGESAGHGIYNAFNRGGTDTAGKMDITSKTIAEMKKMQADGTVSAVGAYQFTEGVLEEAREVAGIAEDAIMTPAVQDRLFWAMLTGGKKRPDLTAYLLGESDDLDAAHEDLALEFAVIQGPDGKGRYDKDKSGNLARIKPDLVREALIKARKEISNL